MSFTLFAIFANSACTGGKKLHLSLENNLQNVQERDIINSGGDNISMFNSEKSEKVRKNQQSMDITIVERVKENLEKKGVILHQSIEADRHLIADGKG